MFAISYFQKAINYRFSLYKLSKILIYIAYENTIIAFYTLEFEAM